MSARRSSGTASDQGWRHDDILWRQNGVADKLSQTRDGAAPYFTCRAGIKGQRQFGPFSLAPIAKADQRHLLAIVDVHPIRIGSFNFIVLPVCAPVPFPWA